MSSTLHDEYHHPINVPNSPAAAQKDSDPLLIASNDNPVPMTPQQLQTMRLYQLITKYLLSVSLCVLVFFLMAMIGAITVHFGFESAIREGIYDAKVLVNGSEAYKAWIRSPAVPATVSSSPVVANQLSPETIVSEKKSSSVQQYEHIIMLNLTNPDLVLKGHKPLYQELPPVVYKKHYYKFDINQSPDNSSLTFRERVWYEVDPEKTKLDPATARVTNINPSYLAVMLQTGGEANLRLLMTGPALEKIMSQMTRDFIAFTFQSYRGALLDMSKNLIGDGVASFCNHWSNEKPATDAGSPWQNMTLRIEPSDEPASIPLETCKSLWDATNEYALNAPVAPAQYHAQLWIDASRGVKEARDTLRQQFTGNLTDTMFDRIFTWFDASYDEHVTWPWIQSTVIEQAGAPLTQHAFFSREDLGFYQWGQGGGIPLYPDQSVAQFLGLPGPPEIYYWAKEKGYDFSVDIPTARKLVPLFTQDNIVEFLKHAQEGTLDQMASKWHLTMEQVNMLALYIDYVMETFVDDSIKTLMKHEQGLISTRTINEWILQYDDPLLDLLGLGHLSSDLMVLKNYQSEEDVRARTGLSIISTGVKDLDATGNFLLDDGTSTLPWIRPDGKPVPIRGTDGTQFQSNLDEDSTITIWFDDVLRPQDFIFKSHEEHQGIPCLRFMLADYMSTHNQTFHNGYKAQANLTALGAPIFIGKWRFYGSEEFLREQVDGLNPPERREDCDTVLDVEPRTGLAMYERKRVQFNIHLPANQTWLNVYHNAMAPHDNNGTLYPIAMIEESADITPELASDFNNQLPKAILLRDVLYWCFVVVSLLCFVVGGLMMLGSFALKNRALGEKR